MKRVLMTALLALAAVSAVSPAMAQNRGRWYDPYGVLSTRRNDNDRNATAPRPYGLIWANSQNLFRDEGWREVTLWAGDTPASALWFEVVSGAIQFDRAQVVFQDGGRLDLSLNGMSRGRGFFPLVDLRGVRRVDRVRVLVRAQTNQARLGLHREE